VKQKTKSEQKTRNSWSIEKDAPWLMGIAYLGFEIQFDPTE